MPQRPAWRRSRTARFAASLLMLVALARLHRHRHLRQVAGARRPAHGRGRLRALPRPPRPRAGDRAAVAASASCAPATSGAVAGARRLPPLQHRPQLRGPRLPAAHHHRGDLLLQPALDLPALDPAPRRGGRAAPLGRHVRRLPRRPRGDAALGGADALGGAPLHRRRALRRALLDPDPHARRAGQRHDPAVLRRPRRHRSARRRWRCRSGSGRAASRAGSPSSPSASSAGARTRSSSSPTASRRPRRWRPVGYAQMLYMIASSWLIFAQPPDVWVLAGAAIVGGERALHLAARAGARPRGRPL